MWKIKKEWKVNTKKSVAVTNFERCLSVNFMKYLKTFQKGNKGLSNLTKHKLKKADRDLLII